MSADAKTAETVPVRTLHLSRKSANCQTGRQEKLNPERRPFRLKTAKLPLTAKTGAAGDDPKRR